MKIKNAINNIYKDTINNAYAYLAAKDKKAYAKLVYDDIIDKVKEYFNGNIKESIKSIIDITKIKFNKNIDKNTLGVITDMVERDVIMSIKFSIFELIFSINDTKIIVKTGITIHNNDNDVQVSVGADTYIAHEDGIYNIEYVIEKIESQETKIYIMFIATILTSLAKNITNG